MKRKYGVILGIVGFILFFFSEGWGANWELLNKYDYGDGWSTKQYYDSKSIVRTNEGNIRVWIRQNDEKVKDDPFEDLPSYKKLIEMNCSTSEVRYLRVLTNLKDGDYEEESQGELNYMVPDSSKGDLQDVLCENK
jgi:hypothetical protein